MQQRVAAFSRLAQQLGGEELERHFALQLGVVRAVNDTHATSTELLLDSVVRDLLFHLGYCRIQRLVGLEKTVELVVGLKRDPVFGPVVMTGLGGIFVEVLRDVAFRKCPVTEAEALAMLADLKGAAMLDGVRGAAPVDRQAVARLIAAASRLGAVMGDRLVELDLNPVLAGPDGAVAVDWLMVLEDGD